MLYTYNGPHPHQTGQAALFLVWFNHLWLRLGQYAVHYVTHFLEDFLCLFLAVDLRAEKQKLRMTNS